MAVANGRPQPPIVFGGVELPAMEVGGSADGTAYLTERVACDLRPPAGEASHEARMVAVSRWSLAARIKHGVRMSELRAHFEALSEAEEALLK